VGLACRYAPDVVVLAGDLLCAGAEILPVEKAHSFDAELVIDILEGMPCPVVYIMGNDDMIELPHRPESIISVNLRRWEMGRYNIVGYQYSLPFMAGIFEKSEDEIAADLRMLAPLVDPQTVFVTHSPAYGILDSGILNAHAGSRSILDMIMARHPHMHIHGHIHQCAGRHGIHWNVANFDCHRATMIDVDTLEDEVVEADPLPA